jgi:putative tryptophan/tyrosine transport system substrate-binding protein
VKRREFITLLGGAAVWPLAARAQRPTSLHIGIVTIQPRTAPVYAAFDQRLRELGHIEAQNLVTDYLNPERQAEGVPGAIKELLRRKVDIIVAPYESTVKSAIAASDTVPVARPGGNVTGTWNLVDDTIVGKGLDFFKLAVPSLARVGALFNPDDPTDGLQIPLLPAAARAIGVTIEGIEVRDLSNLDAVAAQIIRASVQGLFVGVGPFLLSARTEITAMAARFKLPAMYSWREFVDAGGLMSYGSNLPDQYRTAARLVDRILKGAKPGGLPFEIPTRYELIVNLKTAKAMGLNISDSFLLLADEIIE